MGGTYPRIGFYKNIPNEIGDNNGVFVIYNSNADGNRERIEIANGTNSLKIDELSIENN